MKHGCGPFKEGEIYELKNVAGQVVVLLANHDFCGHPDHWESIEKNLFTLEIGDEVVTSNKQIRKVLGFIPSVLENTVYVFSTDNQENVGCMYSAKDIERLGWTVKQSEPTIPEYTMEEAVTKMGHSFKIKK